MAKKKRLVHYDVKRVTDAHAPDINVDADPYWCIELDCKGGAEVTLSIDREQLARIASLAAVEQRRYRRIKRPAAVRKPVHPVSSARPRP